MSAPELLTPRERQLLEAIRKVLDLPKAAPGHYFGRKDAVMERVARLLGATDCIDPIMLIKVTSIIAALDNIAARPFEYKPDPENSLSVTNESSGYTVSYQK